MSENLKWIEVRSKDDLPTDDRRLYWCRLHDGRVSKLVFRCDTGWDTWGKVEDPFMYVAAWAPYERKSPSTPEEKREYDRRRRQGLGERVISIKPPREIKRTFLGGHVNPSLAKLVREQASSEGRAITDVLNDILSTHYKRTLSL